jgi:hypothetical protein
MPVTGKVLVLRYNIWGRAQISAIAKSIEAFGFNAPILVDKNNTIVAGMELLVATKAKGPAFLPGLS